jgi:5-hydroxyisourate hydrolase-like protein (transthyretin family)
MDYSGAFSFTVSFNSVGTYYLRASWSGDADHEGADSTTLSFDVSLTPSYIYLTLSPSTIRLGETITLTGYISPAHSYQSINLYYSKSGNEWFLLTTVTTDSEGYFSYPWTSDSVGTFYMKAEWSGDSDHQDATSEVCTATVSKASSSITIAVSSSSIDLGETILLSGEVSPTHSDVKVEIYVSGDGIQWSFLTSIITDVQGRYTYQWSPTSSGTYYLKACWSGDADHTGDESNISTIEVNSSTTNPDDQGTPNPPGPDNQSPENSITNYLLIALAAGITAIGICLLIILRKRS